MEPRGNLRTVMEIPGMWRLSTRLAFTVAILAGTLPAIAAGPFITIADTTTTIPGGSGNFVNAPGDPCISGNRVGFVGTGGGGQVGVYIFNGGLGVIADTHNKIPGETGNLVSVPNDPCLSGGNAAFLPRAAAEKWAFSPRLGAL